MVLGCREVVVSVQGLEFRSDRDVAMLPCTDRVDIDAHRIESELGWRPEIGFDAGLETTVGWYLSHPEWVRQIRAIDEV